MGAGRKWEVERSGGAGGGYDTQHIFLAGIKLKMFFVSCVSPISQIRHFTFDKYIKGH